MAKTAKSKLEKAFEAIKKYPGEFEKTIRDQLYCKCCNTVVNSTKNFHIEQHRKSLGHQSNIISASIQPKIIPMEKDFAFDLIKMIGSCNIPLSKLREKTFINFFENYGHKVPSETYSRLQINQQSKNIIEKIHSIVREKKIFLIVDETQIELKKFIHVLIGTLENPTEIFLIEHKYIEKCNTTIICQIVDDVLKQFQIERQNFSLFISDAATYMISASKILKTLYDKLICINCFAHLLHNCALKIRSDFDLIDNLISTIRMATLKSNERRMMFKNIPLPPDVILTRWGSWLNAIEYYTSFFPEVKKIVNQFTESGKIVENAQKAINRHEVFNNLLSVNSNYSYLLSAIKKCEETFFTIEDALGCIKNIDFELDPSNVSSYFQLRISNSSWQKIENITTIDGWSPKDVLQLLKCPGTSIAVERSFSLLNKILRKDRNFKLKNIKDYMIIYFNKNC